MVSLIHVDDIATALQSLVEKLPLISGTGVYPVFDFVGHVEGLQPILEGVARYFGFTGPVVCVGPKEGDVLSEALATSAVGDSMRAKTLLGWEPKRLSMLRTVDVMAASWLALTGQT